MKRIGILGGMGPEATIDYYKRIIDAFNAENSNFNNPDIIVYSVNLSRLMSMMNDARYDEAADYLSDKVDALERAGAEFAVISANTPHLMFDKIKEKANIPLISIVEATCDECIKRGFKRPGLIGTGYTMANTFYQDVFSKHGIEIFLPESDEKELIHFKLFSEIELGIFKDQTRQMMVDIIEKMVHVKKIDSLILGCTEFPLILTENNYAGIPTLNTTNIHVDAIIKYCIR